jgi:pimeloyl-ACP methyl ester carboxylesterase
VTAAVKIHFTHPEFDAQLLRALSHTWERCADLGECLSTAARIREGDDDSWYKEWFRTADRILAAGDQSLESGQPVSARESYLRSFNYYRTAGGPLYGIPLDPRLTLAYDRHSEAFRRAAALFSPPAEFVAIPYENTSLPGYFCAAEAGGGRRPTLILTSGYDSSAEELYPFLGAAANRRGYHTLAFDGPGQGRALLHQGLTMRPDWEAVITPVVDYLHTRPDVDPQRIVLYGGSLGGYLAPRAATAEHRLAACIADAAVYDIGGAGRDFFARAGIDPDGDPDRMAPIFERMMQDPTQAFMMHRGMLVHGAPTPLDYVRAIAPYSLAGIAQRISCPTLVTEGESDRRAGSGRQLYDALTSARGYILFTEEEGAGAHCQVGARSLFEQRVFDWLAGAIE